MYLSYLAPVATRKVVGNLGSLPEGFREVSSLFDKHSRAGGWVEPPAD